MEPREQPRHGHGIAQSKLAEKRQAASQHTSRLYCDLHGSANALQARPSGIYNAASYQATQEISPGSWTAIFWDQMVEGQQRFDGSPFPEDLQGTQSPCGATIEALLRQSRQVNSLIPVGLGANTRQQLEVLRHGNTPSVPVDVTVADLLA
jgi:hypothetical protein